MTPCSRPFLGGEWPLEHLAVLLKTKHVFCHAYFCAVFRVWSMINLVARKVSHLLAFSILCCSWQVRGAKAANVLLTLGSKSGCLGLDLLLVVCCFHTPLPQDLGEFKAAAPIRSFCLPALLSCLTHMMSSVFTSGCR